VTGLGQHRLQPLVGPSPAAERDGRAAVRRPARFNRNLDAVRSAVGYWRNQDWLTGDPTRALRRRGRAPDRTRARSRGDVEQLLTHDLPIRERTLWRMLYETAARAGS
jgi:integrase/recombinase XerC/integrase/recombinase XerD